MSKADKMFEELGYQKYYEDNLFTQYEKEDLSIELAKNEILFTKKTKYKTVILSIDELKAIYEFYIERDNLDVK